MAIANRTCVKPGFQLNATRATQPIALRALRAYGALRKRKPQETQAIWLAAFMIGCLDRPFLLAGGCVRCVWMETGFYAMFLIAYFPCVYCVFAHFSYAIGCIACVAFSWKPGASFCNQPKAHYLATSRESRRYVVAFSRFAGGSIWLRQRV